MAPPIQMGELPTRGTQAKINVNPVARTTTGIPKIKKLKNMMTDWVRAAAMVAQMTDMEVSLKTLANLDLMVGSRGNFSDIQLKKCGPSRRRKKQERPAMINCNTN